MRKVEEKSLGVIWFDPNSNRYEFGSWMLFREASRKVNQSLEIIYEIKNLTARLAEKIVRELNAARFQSESTQSKAA